MSRRVTDLAASVAWAGMITAGCAGYALGQLGKKTRLAQHAAALRDYLAEALDGPDFEEALYWPAPQVGDLVTIDNYEHLTVGTVARRKTRWAAPVTLFDDGFWRAQTFGTRSGYDGAALVAWGDVHIESVPA